MKKRFSLCLLEKNMRQKILYYKYGIKMKKEIHKLPIVF